MQVQCKYSIYSKTACINPKLSLVLYDYQRAHFGFDFKFRTIFYSRCITNEEETPHSTFSDSVHISNRGSFNGACRIMYSIEKDGSIQSFRRKLFRKKVSDRKRQSTEFYIISTGVQCLELKY